jgi:hypothetical protein
LINASLEVNKFYIYLLPVNIFLKIYFQNFGLFDALWLLSGLVSKLKIKADVCAGKTIVKAGLFKLSNIQVYVQFF